uniref:Uncharacterized protein n=1 Tax=Romanomermis culicivorax TaxID=13658 RepID=A0A915IXJ0_ROMCU
MYKLNNTCTLDLCFATFNMHVKFNPQFMEQLRASLELALVGSFEEAILLWTKHLHNISPLGPDKYCDMGNMIHTDTYCTIENVFIDVIKPLVHLYRISTCSNSNCPNKEVVTQIDLLVKRITDKIEKFICQEFRRCHEQCKQQLGNQRCSGTRTIGQPELIPFRLGSVDRVGDGGPNIWVRGSTKLTMGVPHPTQLQGFNILLTMSPLEHHWRYNPPALCEPISAVLMSAPTAMPVAPEPTLSVHTVPIFPQSAPQLTAAQPPPTIPMDKLQEPSTSTAQLDRHGQLIQQPAPYEHSLKHKTPQQEEVEY